MTKFILTLTENYETKTYRLTEDMFIDLNVKLEPYRSYSAKSKPVRCIETGEVFKNARDAAVWIKNKGLSTALNPDALIKSECKGKRNTAYGYHWEFVNENDRNTQKPERWLYYASLKNEVNSRRYKITEDLIENLREYLKSYCTSKA